jgi:hypothetical protein
MYFRISALLVFIFLIVEVLFLSSYHVHAQGIFSTASLSQSRGYLVAATVGNLALFAGGVNGTSWLLPTGKSNVVDIYDALSNQWSTASLSQPRDYLTATSVGNLALFAGGININDDSAVVDKICASGLHSWHSGPPKG